MVILTTKDLKPQSFCKTTLTLNDFDVPEQSTEGGIIFDTKHGMYILHDTHNANSIPNPLNNGTKLMDLEEIEALLEKVDK